MVKTVKHVLLTKLEEKKQNLLLKQIETTNPGYNGNIIGIQPLVEATMD